MCLIDNKRFRFTFLPKLVYKVVDTSHKLKQAPFERMQYRFFPFIFANFKLKNLRPFYHDALYYFDEGWIHSYIFKKEAENCARWLGKNNEVYVGIIPPFSRYGLDVKGTEICSRGIIILSKLK